jgi:hypothetical protein
VALKYLADSTLFLQHKEFESLQIPVLEHYTFYRIVGDKHLNLITKRGIAK